MKSIGIGNASFASTFLSDKRSPLPQKTPVKRSRIEDGAKRGKARLIHSAAIARRPLTVLFVFAAPRGGDICQGPFHGRYLLCSVVGVNPSPRPSHSWEGGGSGESSPSLDDRWHTRGGRSRAKPPAAVAKPLLTARARICEKATGDGESFKSRVSGRESNLGPTWPEVSLTFPARPSFPVWRFPSACPSTRPEVSKSDPSFHGASCPCRNTG